MFERTVQNQGGALFALWKRAAAIFECDAHRAILLANSGIKNDAKLERHGLPQSVLDVISNTRVLQCGGVKQRGLTLQPWLCVAFLIPERSGTSAAVAVFFVDISQYRNQV